MKWYRKSHVPNKMRSDGGLKINASILFKHNCFCTFGAQLNSESSTAEGWVHSPNPSRKNLARWPSLLNCLHLDHWSKSSLFVQDGIEDAYRPVCVCVCVCLGSSSLHMRKIAKAKTMLPQLEKMRSFVSGLLNRTSFSWSAVASLHFQELTRFITLLYI